MSGTESNNSRMHVGRETSHGSARHGFILRFHINYNYRPNEIRSSTPLKPIACQVAANGSRTMITSCIDANLQIFFSGD